MSDFLPFVVIGISVGAIYGLAGTGLVLTYKTSGIFNFAYGALATVSVFVFHWLHYQHGLAWPLAAVICVFVLGPAMGILLELLARQLMTVDHTLQIASTIGLVLWVVALGGIWFQHVTGSFPPFLPTSTVEIGSVNVQWQQIIVVIVSLVATIALYGYLRFTRLGTGMRAVVDDPDLLSLTGSSPIRVRRWAWIIGSSFAALSGLLIAPSLPINALLLTLLVVQAFGAAAIGYFSNLPLTYAGGIAIGIAGALATKYVVDVPWLAGLPAGLPFIVLFVVLLVTPRAKLAARRFIPPRTIPPSWHAPVRVRVVVGRALRRIPVCDSVIGGHEGRDLLGRAPTGDPHPFARAPGAYVTPGVAVPVLVRGDRRLHDGALHQRLRHSVVGRAAPGRAGRRTGRCRDRDPCDPALGCVPRARNAGLRHPPRTDGVHAGLHVRHRCSDAQGGASQLRSRLRARRAAIRACTS